MNGGGKDFIQPECGGQNPLMKATQHFTKDQTHRSVTGVPYEANGELENEFINQQNAHLMNQPQTFEMNSLLHSLDHERKLQEQQMQQSSQWANEFNTVNVNSFQAGQQNPWVDQFHKQQTSSQFVPQSHNEARKMGLAPYKSQLLEEQWNQLRPGPSTTFNSAWQQGPNFSTRETDTAMTQRELENYNEVEEVWKEVVEKDEKLSIAEAAKQVSDQLEDDDKMRNTEFNKFMHQLQGQELGMDKQQTVHPSNWEDEFLNQQQSGGYFDDLEEEWTRNDENHEWLERENEKEYEFNEANPYEASASFEDGVRRMESGDLSSAILIFESVVKNDMDHNQAWYYLGHCQQQNEQDTKAIPALKKALTLDPSNLPAMMALAVSYANESETVKAMNHLKQWILNHPEYSEYAKKTPGMLNNQTEKPYIYNIKNSETYVALERAFVEVVRMSPTVPDADVQCALGILYHLDHDHEKAADCFRAALSVRPDDAQLWNKLGATLANGSKSEEAVMAYRRALELNPGYTRSRFNLGISCINLNANREAVEHFLTALDHQKSARGPSGEVGETSDNVWGSLSMVLNIMRDEVAYQQAQNKDLDSLMRKFLQNNSTVTSVK